MGENIFVIFCMDGNDLKGFLIITFKKLISQITVIDNYCKLCGEKAEAFQVPDKKWKRITRQHHRRELCLNCFKDLERRR